MRRRKQMQPPRNQNRWSSRTTPQNCQFCSKILVTLNFASWNQLNEWLRQIERLRRAA